MSIFNLRHLIIIIILFFGALLHGQEEKSEDNSVSLGFHIFDIFRSGSPGLKISYEDARLDRWSWLVEANLISDFNARIYRWSESERGILGAGTSGAFMYSFPLKDNDHYDTGLRLNYTFKHRKIEKWVSMQNDAFSQLIDYTQNNHDLGLYLRLGYSRKMGALNKDKENGPGFMYSFVVNPGVMFQFVDTSLPENSTVNRDESIFTPELFSYYKDAGNYIFPHIYFEFILALYWDK